MRGQVKSYSDFRGFGFIASSDRDYFVHISQIAADGFKTLVPGQEVEFEPLLTDRGWQARDVHLVSSEADSTEGSKFVLKRNPFTPQDPIRDPAKFAGRKEPFRNAVDALYNNKNVLILGPRGIGKSSVSYQLLYMTQGETTLLDRLGIDMGEFDFNYVCGDFRCVPGTTLAEIASGLISTLQMKLNKREKVKESRGTVGLDLKFLKASVDYTRVPITPSELCTQFVSEVEAIFRGTGALVNGISFLIDEIDVLEDRVEIAPFLKATIEKFRLDGFDNISFIVSGVTGTTTTLITQHQSSTRLFEMLELQRMNDEELIELVELTLKGTGVTVTEGALTKILTLSNRFPQPVHLLGYHSFRVDTNGVLEENDVEEAMEFIVQSLKRQEFQDKLEKLGRGVLKDILLSFAAAPLETVDLNFLTHRLSDVSYDEILGTLGRLEQRGILEKQFRGVYRFREPLFKIYLRWTFGLNALTDSQRAEPSQMSQQPSGVGMPVPKKKAQGT